MTPVLLVPCHIHKKKLNGKINTKPPLYVHFFHFKVFLKKKKKIIMLFGLQIETKMFNERHTLGKIEISMEFVNYIKIIHHPRFCAKIRPTTPFLKYN